jgi:type I restriction enzyme S subunit
MSDLPTGWVIGGIQSLYDVNPGHRGIEIGDETDVSFIPMTSIEENSGRLHADLVKKYRDLKGGYTKFINGDVVFAKITPCMENGKIAVANNLKNGIACGTTELHVFRPLVNGSAQYLLYFLLQDSVREEARRCFQGTSGHLRVPASFFDNLKFPIPPLNEQRRIGAKLKVLLGKVDACKKRLERIPDILKRFRQSVLAAACSGRLTADWREADSFVNDMPSNWRKCRLSDLSVLITKGASPKWQGVSYSSTGVLFITSENVGHGKMLLGTRKYVESEINEIQPRSVLNRGDLLTNIVGASIGRSAIYDADEIANINQAVALIRLNNTVDRNYILQVLNSPSLVCHMGVQKVDVARANLSLKDVANFPIPLPPFPEQCKIVRRVEALFKVSDQIEARYAKAKAYMDKLTQSILAKAFRGELVSQNPDDEPASVLLERICAERTAALHPAAKPRRTKASSHIKHSGRRKSVKRETPS